MVSEADALIDEVDDSLCAVCFDVLEEALNVWLFDTNTILQNAKPRSRECLDKLVSNNVAAPLFVTWMLKTKDGHEDLRGCIGTLEPIRLDGLKRYAHLSAFGDDRFEPIDAQELEHLVCKVSILHSYEDCKDWQDWEVGTHGVIINFVHKRRYSATYLPEVALEHGMSKQTAIAQLIRKSGFRLPITDELLASLQVTRYQSKRIKLDYLEYKKMNGHNECS